MKNRKNELIRLIKVVDQNVDIDDKGEIFDEFSRILEKLDKPINLSAAEFSQKRELFKYYNELIFKYLNPDLGAEVNILLAFKLSIKHSFYDEMDRIYAALLTRRNFWPEAFLIAAKHGRVILVDKLYNLAMSIPYSLELDLYEAFTEAAANGHLAVAEKIFEFLDTEQRAEFIKKVGYKSFKKAVKNGHLAIVEKILSLFSDPTQLQEILSNDNYIIFRYAVQNGHLAIVEKILSLFSNPTQLQEMLSNDNYIIFRYAVKNGHIKIVEKLWELYSLEERPKVLADTNKKYPYIKVITSGILSNNAEILDFLLKVIPAEKWPKIIKECNYKILVSALKSGNLDMLNRLLAFVPVDIQKSLILSCGNEALCFAVEGNNSELVKKLHDFSPDVDHKEFMIHGNQGQAFWGAVNNNNPSMIKLLLDLTTNRDNARKIIENILITYSSAMSERSIELLIDIIGLVGKDIFAKYMHNPQILSEALSRQNLSLLKFFVAYDLECLSKISSYATFVLDEDKNFVTEYFACYNEVYLLCKEINKLMESGVKYKDIIDYGANAKDTIKVQMHCYSLSTLTKAKELVVNEIYLYRQLCQERGLPVNSMEITGNLGQTYLTLEQACKITERIDSISLKYCGLNDDRAIEIAKHLKNNTLFKLDLEGNNISDEGAKAIAAALQDNKSLEKLNLSNNLIGEEGIVSLLKVVANKKNFTLNIDNNDIEDEKLAEIKTKITEKENVGAGAAKSFASKVETTGAKGHSGAIAVQRLTAYLKASPGFR